MQDSQTMPHGYAMHLERAKAFGRDPLTLQQWEKVAREMDEMPGTMAPPTPVPPQQSAPRS